MAIREFSSSKPRQRVALFGIDMMTSEIRQAFAERGYLAEIATEEQLSDSGFLSATDSLIFVQDARRPTSIRIPLERFAKNALDFDCRIYVRVTPGEKLQGRTKLMVVHVLQDLKLPAAQLPGIGIASGIAQLGDNSGSQWPPFIYICDSGISWGTNAQLIADNPAGPQPNRQLQIVPKYKKKNRKVLTGEQVLLIQRAFWDCSNIHLHQMDDGLSGAPVFRVMAELTQGLYGPWPFLYFLKLGDRSQIEREFFAYQGVAVAYIPFHLGPRLNVERCGLGAESGILVGDFVANAEALRNCAREGRAGHAIANLFHRTLYPWRGQATRVQKPLPDFFLDSFLSIPEHRLGKIRALGGKASIDELSAMFKQCHSDTVLVGPIHGDLHATNVLVRSGDAIVIDFEKVVRDMPLVFDPASLEGGLLVDGFETDERAETAVEELLTSLEPLYSLDALLTWGDGCHPTDASSWFYDCVAQIRGYSRTLECSPGQYAAVLAVCLIRKGCNPYDGFTVACDNLRALSFVLGERILEQLALYYQTS